MRSIIIVLMCSITAFGSVKVYKISNGKVWYAQVRKNGKVYDCRSKTKLTVKQWEDRIVEDVIDTPIPTPVKKLKDYSNEKIIAEIKLRNIKPAAIYSSSVLSEHRLDTKRKF